MKKQWLMGVLGMCAVIAAVVACRRTDVRTVRIDVPQMNSEREIRIITNATLDEVVGRYDGIQHDYEIDLSRKLVLYHESQNLLSPDYQARIVARLREVGFTARIIDVRLNPPGLVPTEDGPVQMWPDRFTAVISVPDMTSQTSANRVVDAIGYARVGRDSPGISVRRDSRTVVATYESLRLSLKNIEYAIACVGFDANNVPGNLGRQDALPHGWTPVRL